MEGFKPIDFGGEPAGPKLVQVDAKGLNCPGPVMSLQDQVVLLQVGDQVHIEATDPGFVNDLTAWVAITGHKLLRLEQKEGLVEALIEKQPPADKPAAQQHVALIVFSDEMDKALAAFNIVLGAVGCGKQVSVFFTFWGLSLLRVGYHAPGKSAEQQLLDKALPKDREHLPLSHLNMMGLGTQFMERLMRKQGVSSLDFMLHLARMKGVELIACQMSMDLMGIRKDELLEGVQVGGVATFLQRAEQAGMSMFI